MTMKTALSILSAIALFAACGPEPQPHFKPAQNTDSLKSSLAEVNKRQVNDEALQIDNYVKRHNMQVTKTATGLRYSIYQKSSKNGPLAKKEDIALVHFTCYMLDGKELYTSRKTGPVEIWVDHDDVESGVHEGLKYMRVGDKAKFVLPSHLAHGVVGDANKIPPLTPVVYDIELIKLTTNTNK